MPTPYIEHSVGVAGMLIDNFGILDFFERLKNLPKHTEPITLQRTAIVAALLHDVLEDKVMTDEELFDGFGAYIYYIVKLLTKQGESGNREPEEEYFKRLIAGKLAHKGRMPVVIANSVGGIPIEVKNILRQIAVLIKIADRIHSMQTLNTGNRKFEVRKFFETLGTYIPSFIDLLEVDSDFERIVDLALTMFYENLVLAGQKCGLLNEYGNIIIEELEKFLELLGNGARNARISREYIEVIEKVRKHYLFIRVKEINPDIENHYIKRLQGFYDYSSGNRRDKKIGGSRRLKFSATVDFAFIVLDLAEKDNVVQLLAAALAFDYAMPAHMPNKRHVEGLVHRIRHLSEIRYLEPKKENVILGYIPEDGSREHLVNYINMIKDSLDSPEEVILFLARKYHLLRSQKIF